jgi:integrase
MATVYKRGRVWWAAGVDRFGERWQRSTKQTVEDDAKLVAAQLEEELANDAHRSKDEACTLESVLDELITFSEASGRSKSTLEFLQTKAKHLVRVIGPRRQCSVISPAITSAYAQTRIKEGAHRHTVSFEVRVLMQALRRAAKLRRFKPEFELRDLKPDEVRNAYQPRDRWLTPTEYGLLLAELNPERGGRTRRRRLKTAAQPTLSDDVVGLGKLKGPEQWSEEIARTVLLAWARSGEPMRPFARDHGFSVQRMLWWRERLGMVDELATISATVQAMHDHRELEEDRRDYVIVMCQTGARLKELHGIEADHVSLKRRTLFIAGTKTKKARRTVPITDAVVEAFERRIRRFPRGPLFPVWGKVQRDLYAACLRIERRQNPPEKRVTAKRSNTGRVQNPKGNPVPKSERVRPAHAFDPVTPNDLRRTYASWLAQAGVPMLHAMKLMGHGSTQMLERVYAHLTSDNLREAVALLPREVTQLADTNAITVRDDV